MGFWIAMANNHPDALDCSCDNITPPAFNTVSSMCFIQKLYKQNDTRLSFLFLYQCGLFVFFSEAILMWFPYVFWISSYSLNKYPSQFPSLPSLQKFLQKSVVWLTNASFSMQWPRWARKAKAHEEPIRGPSSQHQRWEASQLSVWTMGTQLNKNILQKWETEREGGRDLGRNVQASSRRDNTLCLPWDQNREGLVSRGTKYIRSVLKLWAEVIYGSAAVQTPILTAASTMAQSC